MANLQEFIAFKAAVALLEERGMLDVMEKVYQECKAMVNRPKEECHENYVKQIYAPFSDDDISKMIGKLVTDEGSDVPVECIYQTIDGLHEACPGHTGDWYFSGNYPTPGGLKLLYKAYVDYYENIVKE
jgi:amidophosphoribosyltransferase